MSRASTSYKKKDGFLAVGDDKRFLFWTPAAPAGSSPALTVPIGDITNLQQTPANTPKIALKVVVQPSGAAAADNHIFTFTSATTARSEQEAITEILRNALAAIKSSNTLPAAPAPAGDGSDHQSAAMAIAQAVSAGARKATDDGWYDDARLKSDIDLQRSLLESNDMLKQRFNESLRDKPDSINPRQFSTQFWSSRLHLLRAHAIEKAQAQGDYNVLPEIKFKRIAAEKEGEPDKLMLNLAKEQVKLIFKQYPIVREAYNENVPQIDQNQFWSRFFMSRLLKRLKGEKITDADAPDGILDKYLDHRPQGPTSIGQIPHFIDLEGNEQNHSQRQGNRPDETMRPGSVDKVGILRVLNNLSEKMMAQVAPSDVDPSAPNVSTEDTYSELQLRDLQTREGDNRVVLNIKDQQRFLSGDSDNQLSADAILYAKHSPSKVLSAMRRDLDPSTLGDDKNGSLRLDTAIGVQSDSDSSDEEEAKSRPNGHSSKVRVGGSAALSGATTTMLKSIRNRRNIGQAGNEDATFGLSQETFDTLTMTHNTTIEFLHYFWTLFLSGDSSRTQELGRLIETLDKSLDRIHAVATKAEEERSKRLDALNQAMVGLNPKGSKRRRLEIDLERVGGGRKAVDMVVKPTVQALAEATAQYKKAFEEQSRGAE